MSILGTFASYTLLLYSEHLYLFFLSRIVVGLLKNTETSCYSIITDISNPTIRVKRMAYIGSAIGLGFILGPALSGVLTTTYSLESPAYVSSVMLILNAIITLVFLPETSLKRKVSSELSSSSSTTENGVISDFNANYDLSSLNDDIIDELGSPIDLLSSSGSDILRTSDDEMPSPEARRNDAFNEKSRGEDMSIWNLLMKPNPLRVLVWVYFGTSMAIMVFQGSSVLLFQLLGMTVQETSYIISYSGLLTVISSIIIQWLTSFYSESQLIRYSILIVSLTLFSTVFVLTSEYTLVGLLIVFIPFTLGARTLKNCLLGSVTHQAPSSQTGTIIGVLNSLESLCRALTPLIGGVLMDIFIGAPAFSGALLLLFFFAWIRRNPIFMRDLKEKI